MRSEDDSVRALAAELARHRPRGEGERCAPALAELLDDPSSEVRRQAHASLVAILGSDLGGEGPGAPERWRAHLGAPPPR
jgi:HEAT repeat protein